MASRAASETGMYRADGKKEQFTYSSGNKHRWKLELDLDGLNFDLGYQSNWRESYYPCFVMSARNLKRLNRLPFHEQALKSGLLEQVDDLSVIRDSCIFVSHVWEDRDYEHPEDDLMQGGNGHPEDASNGKLKWLQKAKKHLHLADKNYYVWFDFFSVPQHPDNFYFKMLAIRSIPFYMSLVGTIVPLIRQDNSHPDHDQQYARDLGLAAYQRRGWCRLEALAALCPKKYPHGKFCIGGPVHYYYYNTKKGETSQGAQLGLSDMLNPFDGEFEKPGDTELIESVVDALASRYHEYETKMGRTSTWDLCIRVHDRPGWLKDIEDDQDPESFESDNSWRPSVKPNSLSLPGASIAADTVVRWGEAQLRHGDMQGATCAFTISVFLCPDRPEPHVWLGMLFGMRSSGEARSHLFEENAVQKVRARTYRTFYSDKAIECFRSAIEIRDVYPIAHFALAEALTVKRIMSQAVKEYQIALAQMDTVNIEYKKLLVFFEDSQSVTLEARNNERDKEARRLRQELTHGWSIKRATD